MKHMKKCRRCWWQTVKDRQAVETWLLEVLGAEFYFQWHQRDQMGRTEQLVHPDVYRRWLEKGPCEDCPCAAHCDEICSLRARWWDAKIARLT